MHLFLCLFKAYAAISSTLFKPKLQWCFGMFFVSQLFICRVGMWLPSLKATLVMYRQTRRDLIALTVVSLATSSPAHVMARSDTHTCFDLLIFFVFFCFLHFCQMGSSSGLFDAETSWDAKSPNCSLPPPWPPRTPMLPFAPSTPLRVPLPPAGRRLLWAFCSDCRACYSTAEKNKQVMETTNRKTYKFVVEIY